MKTRFVEKLFRGLAAVLIFIGPGATHLAATDQAPVDEAQAMSEYSIGVFLLEQDAAKEAIPHFEAAWTMSAHDVFIGHKLAEAYFQVGSYTDCEAIVDEILDVDEGNHDVLFLKAKLVYLRGQKEESLAYLKRARDAAEPSFEVEHLIARVLEELGDDEGAIEAFRSALRLGPSRFRTHYQLGQLLQKTGRVEEAEESFRKCIEVEPRFTDASRALVTMLFEQGRADEAESLVESLGEGERSGEWRRVLAEAYMDEGKPGEAIRVLESGGPVGELSLEAQLLLGDAYREAEDWAGAFDVFEGIYARGVQSDALARAIGEVALQGQDPETAHHYYREAIRLGPGEYRNYLALFFATLEGFSGAGAVVIETSDEERRSLLEGAADVADPDDGDSQFTIGYAYQRLEDYEKAEKHFRRALELQPDNERALINLASVLEKMRRYEEAEPYLVRLYDLKPDDPTVCNFYGYLLALLSKDLDKAERLVKAALKQEPGNGYYLDSLGWVYYKRGEFERAVIELERAAEVVTNDPIILEHLGDAYNALERYGKALAAYERSRDLRSEKVDILEKIDAARKLIGD